MRAMLLSVLFDGALSETASARRLSDAAEKSSSSTSLIHSSAWGSPVFALNSARIAP
jgi:hypothetical protein